MNVLFGFAPVRFEGPRIPDLTRRGRVPDRRLRPADRFTMGYARLDRHIDLVKHPHRDRSQALLGRVTR